MDAPRNQFFFPATFAELFQHWSQAPDAVPFAGGTRMARYCGERARAIPRNVLSLHRLEDLRRVTRSERYLEIGAMVTLNEIIGLGKIVPEVFIRCLSEAGDFQIRNLGTLGGNICACPHRLDAAAPLIALDAHCELRAASGVRWISAARFFSDPGSLALGPRELLTRIRIPLGQWDYSLYRKFKAGEQGNRSAVTAFMLRNQKNVLTDIRLVFSGDAVLRDRNSETLLIGKPLPLERRDVHSFVEQWEAAMLHSQTQIRIQSRPLMDDFLRARIVNFIATNLLSLTD
ncbi:MAG: FAD binding domain-containing protein [Spirochaetaceae bacterium]|jgi:CO/xanthine dehydrogenase FAD-binding subunit|nr:FAD binding domain-containing protein [Spirochaetaceae bacterium]